METNHFQWIDDSWNELLTESSAYHTIKLLVDIHVAWIQCVSKHIGYHNTSRLTHGTMQIHKLHEEG